MFFRAIRVERTLARQFAFAPHTRDACQGRTHKQYAEAGESYHLRRWSDNLPTSHERPAGSDRDRDAFEDRGSQRHAENVEPISIGNRAEPPAESEGEHEQVLLPPHFANRIGP